jgi:hypothetical protein
LPFQRGEKLVSGFRRFVQVFTLPLDRCTDRARREVQKVNDEIVGVLSFDAAMGERLSREISQVEGYDYISPAANRSRQDVSLVGVGKRDGSNQVLVVRNQAIADMDIHQGAGAFELLAGQVRPIFQEAPNPLIMNSVGPFRAKKVGQGQVHQQIAQRGRIQDASIANGGEIRHAQ